MITCPTSIAIDDMPFQEYLKLEGYSHSFLKYQKNGIVEPKEVTANMQIGTLVDGILCEPETVNMQHELYAPAKAIAYELQKKHGNLIKAFKKQVSYTATMQYNGFQLPVKGRLDFMLEKFAVIDLKVTWSKNAKGLINYMGYNNQLYGYCNMAGLSKGYILIYSVPTKEVNLIEIPVSGSNQFWENAIMSFGTTIQTSH